MALKKLKKKFYEEYDDFHNYEESSYQFNPDIDKSVYLTYLNLANDHAHYQKRSAADKADYEFFKTKVDLFWIMYGKNYGQAILDGKIKKSTAKGTPFVANRGTFKNVCKQFGLDPKAIPKSADNRVSKAITNAMASTKGKVTYEDLRDALEDEGGRIQDLLPYMKGYAARAEKNKVVVGGANAKIVTTFAPVNDNGNTWSD